MRPDFEISHEIKGMIAAQDKTLFENCTQNGRKIYNMFFSDNGEKSDIYFEEIFEMAKRIIESKDYSLLVSTLISYDMTIKKHIDSNSKLNSEDLSRPFWCFSTTCCDTRHTATGNN